MYDRGTRGERVGYGENVSCKYRSKNRTFRDLDRKESVRCRCMYTHSHDHMRVY